MKSILALMALLAGLFALPQIASAQATRTWVSGVGDDVNPCSRTAPCKTFAGAISKTAANGEINCLDPGGFGTITIIKPIALVCDPFFGSVLGAGTNGVNINVDPATYPNAEVLLSGLDIEGVNSGLNGVNINTNGAARVTIRNSLIRGFNTNGIRVENSAGAVLVEVIDTAVSEGGEGILVKPSGAASARVSLSRVRTYHNTGDGVFVSANTTTANARLSARDSQSDHNGADGYTVFSNGGVAQIMLDECGAYNNARGLVSTGSNATLRFARCSITGNGTGVFQDTANHALSYGNNSVDGNGTDGTFGSVAPR